MSGTSDAAVNAVLTPEQGSRRPFPLKALRAVIVVVALVVFVWCMAEAIGPKAKSWLLLLVFGFSATTLVTGIVLQERKYRTREMILFPLLAAVLTWIWLPFSTMSIEWPARKFSVNGGMVVRGLEKAHKAGVRPTSIQALLDGDFLKGWGPEMFKELSDGERDVGPADYRWTWEFNAQGEFVGVIGLQGTGENGRRAPACLRDYSQRASWPDDYWRGVRCFGIWPWEQAKLPESFKPVGPAR